MYALPSPPPKSVTLIDFFGTALFFFRIPFPFRSWSRVGPVAALLRAWDRGSRSPTTLGSRSCLLRSRHLRTGNTEMILFRLTAHRFSYGRSCPEETVIGLDHNGTVKGGPSVHFSPSISLTLGKPFPSHSSPLVTRSHSAPPGGRTFRQPNSFGLYE